MMKCLLFLICFVSVQAVKILPENLDDYLEFRNQSVDSKQYQCVMGVDQKEISALQKNLSPKKFPLLPPSYRWAQDLGGTWSIEKHELARETPIGLYVFGSDKPHELSYVIHHNNRLVYSYAQTRSKTYTGDRTPFQFKKGKISYVDGHAIDHADTPEEMFHFYPGFTSTNHRANHLPEPPNSYWGLHIRNPLVKEIRSTQGDYSQYVHYSDPESLTDSSVPIPEGILFFEHDSSGKLLSGWQIPWDDPLHQEAPGKGPRTKLRHHQVLNQPHHLHFLPYLKKRETFVEMELGLNCDHFQTSLNPLPLYQIETLADFETIPYYAPVLYGNGLFCTKSHEQENLIHRTNYWGKRALNQMQSLEQNDFDIFMADIDHVQQILDALKVSEIYDPHDQSYDAWHQIFSIQKDQGYRHLSKIDIEQTEVSPALHVLVHAERGSPLRITLPKGKGSLTPIHISSTELATKRTLYIDVQSKDSWTTRRLNLFLDTNQDILKSHRENIADLLIEPADYVIKNETQKKMDDILKTPL